VLFNDKLALFRLKAKGKRKGYKVLHVWAGDQLVCLPLELSRPTNVLLAQSPPPPPGLAAATAPPAGVNRLRPFSRSPTDATALSPRTATNTPTHSSSPRGSRLARNLRDFTTDITEDIDQGITFHLPQCRACVRALT
jgi:hypothetical protein